MKTHKLIILVAIVAFLIGSCKKKDSPAPVEPTPPIVTPPVVNPPKDTTPVAKTYTVTFQSNVSPIVISEGKSDKLGKLIVKSRDINYQFICKEGQVIWLDLYTTKAVDGVKWYGRILIDGKIVAQDSTLDKKILQVYYTIPK